MQVSISVLGFRKSNTFEIQVSRNFQKGILGKFSPARHKEIKQSALGTWSHAFSNVMCLRLITVGEIVKVNELDICLLIFLQKIYFMHHLVSYSNASDFNLGLPHYQDL